VRQLLNHTPGWLGDDIQDFGRGDDAVAHYVASMTRLPQMNPPGAVFAYNNAGLVVAGRIIEVVTGSPYESMVQNLLIDPLQLSRTHYFSDRIIGLNVAASHNVVTAKRSWTPTFGRFAQHRPHRRADFQRARSVALRQVSPRGRHRPQRRPPAEPRSR